MSKFDEVYPIVEGELSPLTPRQEKVLALVETNSYTMKEIARMLNTGIGSVACDKYLAIRKKNFNKNLNELTSLTPRCYNALVKHFRKKVPPTKEVEKGWILEKLRSMTQEQILNISDIGNFKHGNRVPAYEQIQLLLKGQPIPPHKRIGRHLDNPRSKFYKGKRNG
jgi:DNA-binding CsgD family transcriptional regulator